MPGDFSHDSMLELYLYESTSLLESLDNILLKAEADGILTNGNINEIFRIMHTIKGSSAMMTFAGIAEVAHKTEDLFAVIRNSGLRTEYFNELFDTMLAVSDFLKTEVGSVQDGKSLEPEIAQLTAVVTKLTEKMRSSAQGHADSAPPRNPVALPQILPPEPETPIPVAPDLLAADISKVTARAAAEASEPGGKETYFLHIHFNDGSRMENIRAFMLVTKLNEKGIVNRTIPANPETNPDAVNDIAEQGFYVSYTTSLFREQIETLIKGTLSVETVSFMRRMPDGTARTPAAPEPQKPDPRPTPIHGMSYANSTTPGRTEPIGEARLDASYGGRVTPDRPMPKAAWPQAAALPAQRIENPVQERPVFIDVTQRPPDAKPAPVSAQNTSLPIRQERLAPHAAPVHAQRPAIRTANPEIIMPPPLPPESGVPAAPPSASAAQNIISVELKKLDNLLNLVGEIVINESIVTENDDLEGLELANFRKAAHQLDKLTDELQDTVMAIRMLPVSIIFQRMRRIVRDMGKSLSKETDLVLVGETTEVDKTIMDALSDPIMHLVRNAMDHAIEPPEERIAVGKSPLGHIILSAQNSGGDVIISVSDDGRGLDKDLILNRARANGLLRKLENEYTDREVYNLLMTPGFSTRDSVSEYSGRGVGLDVVKSNIEKIGGSALIESKKGLGTNIIMKIPLTLATISCIEIAVANDIFSIPINNICESFKVDAGQLITDPSGDEMIMLRGQAYTIMRLHELFGIKDAITDIKEGILMLVEAGDQKVCFFADRIIGKFQVVVKPLPTFLSRFNANRTGISGCTIMGNGKISLIINVPEIIH